jgi:hypothetical protein
LRGCMHADAAAGTGGIHIDAGCRHIGFAQCFQAGDQTFWHTLRTNTSTVESNEYSSSIIQLSATGLSHKPSKHSYHQLTCCLTHWNTSLGCAIWKMTTYLELAKCPYYKHCSIKHASPIDHHHRSSMLCLYTNGRPTSRALINVPRMIQEIQGQS